jgi:hypothetical protein
VAAQAPDDRVAALPTQDTHLTREQQRRDSVRMVRGARAAQADFERIRFRHLPWIPEQGRASYCDEVIGRFCFWDDGGESDWAAPPEADEVREGRERLLARLDSAAARAPGDGWVAGQRVRYLLEAGRREEAVAAAAECRGAPWWCLALSGLALHSAGRWTEAEKVFESALSAMPARERRDWDDLSPVLADGDARAFRRLEGPAREAAERRFWWLADPLWTVPGNDRRTAHFARLVVDALQDHARTTEGWVWGNDLREIVLRFGTPVGWERVRERPWASAGSRPAVVVHYEPRSWEFLPTFRMVRDSRRLADEDWNLNGKAARVRTQYTPAYANRFGALEHQVAAFRRGERVVVLAGYDLDADSVPAGAATEAALVLVRDETAEPTVVRSTGDGATGTLRAETAADSLFAEVVVRADSGTLHRVGRARFALGVPALPRAGIGLSDVLVLSRADALPETLEEAATRVRPSTRVRAGERIGLFWEVYRPAEGAAAASDTLETSVSVERVGDAGLVRRLGQALGVTGRDSPVRVTWKQEAGGQPVLARSLAVAIPDVRPGSYVLRISVRHNGGELVTTTRKLTVVE